METIDFSDCYNFDNIVLPIPVLDLHKTGQGSSLSYSDYPKLRFHVLYKNDIYLVKTGKGYTYECFGEYIGSHIYNILGIKAQETLLGTIGWWGETIPAVACKLVNTEGKFIRDFSGPAFKYGITESKYSLEYYLQVAKQQTWLAEEDFVTQIWTVLAVDAYIGNYDRFFPSNWGVIQDEVGNYSMLPVLDNGNCLWAHAMALMPSLRSDILGIIRSGRSIVNEDSETNMRLFDDVTWKGETVNYVHFFQSIDDGNCVKHFGEIIDRINEKEGEIYKMIDDMPLASVEDKRFFKAVLYQRRRDILEKQLQNIVRV